MRILATVELKNNMVRVALTSFLDNILVLPCDAGIGRHSEHHPAVPVDKPGHILLKVRQGAVLVHDTAVNIVSGVSGDLLFIGKVPDRTALDIGIAGEIESQGARLLTEGLVPMAAVEIGSWDKLLELLENDAFDTVLPSSRAIPQVNRRNLPFGQNRMLTSTHRNTLVHGQFSLAGSITPGNELNLFIAEEGGLLVITGRRLLRLPVTVLLRPFPAFQLPQYPNDFASAHRVQSDLVEI
jgi:hypothetical protein